MDEALSNFLVGFAAVVVIVFLAAYPFYLAVTGGK